MDDNGENIYSDINDIDQVNPKDLEAFKQEMTESVIPEIIRVVEARCVLASESRERQLKC